jgi:Grx4 family monothiol glutaredoxin
MTAIELDGRIPQALCLVNLYADWHAPCIAMNETFAECSRQFPSLTYYQVCDLYVFDCKSLIRNNTQGQAEDFPELSETLEISSVPTFLILEGGKVKERLEGANAPALSALAEKYAKIASQKQQDGSATTTTPSTSTIPLETRLNALVSSHPMMLFIKGTPTQPACGFSKQAVELLKTLDASYGSFDILSDEVVRQGLKTQFEWPTFPQLYIHGELIGGLDILKELIANGEFAKMMPVEESLDSRLKKLINKDKVVLFMKGTKETPKCGFSRQVCCYAHSFLIFTRPNTYRL